MSKTQLEKTIFAAGSLPYVGFWDEKLAKWQIEPEYDGLTNFEVMSIKLAQRAAHGDLKAIDMIFDRTMGKPAQKTETLTTQLSYGQYLELIANEENSQSSAITISYEPIEDEPVLPSIYDDEDDEIDEMARGF